MENRKRLKYTLPGINIGTAVHAGTFFSIPVKVHWTFGLLLIFALWSAFINSFGLSQTIGFLVHIAALFLCVICHEYGHALAARRFGIRTKDIILSPIGGLARLEKLPQQPIQEFFIAITGPVVNLIIGLFFAIVVWIFSGSLSFRPDINHLTSPEELLHFMVVVNLALFAFNLIPAFPMDGGRILRSLLAVRMGKDRATNVAYVLGRVIAIILIITGIFMHQPVLWIIGIFIFMMAGSEFEQVKLDKLMKSATAAQIQLKDFHKVYTDESYASILNHVSKRQQNFLVFDRNDKIVGAIPYAYLAEAARSGQPPEKASDKMFTKTTSVGENIVLEELIQLMKREQFIIVGVEDASGNITGTIDRERIERFLQHKGV